MFTRGEFSTGGVTYGAIVNNTKTHTEAILVTSGTVVSAYKVDETGSYSYNNVRAKELVKLLQSGIKGCTSKNSVPMPFELGAMTQHEFIKAKIEYIMQMHRGELVGAYIQSDDKRVELQFVVNAQIPDNIPYVKLTEVKKDLDLAETDLDAVQVRSVQEIALEKEDITWLENKKYYIVNDDETAEKLFQFLENYNGVIAYDTETTGLRINCFGKIGSSYMETLVKYNAEHPQEQIRADRLVGIIFCVEKDVSYYFPCFNRKFKNLYQDLESPIRIQTINNIKARYTVGDLKDSDGDMIKYVKNTPSEEFDLGVILMERCRDILEKHHLVAHNGSFEWKVGWQYEIDTNVKDDTMIMHQLMYKFRSTTRNSGEPSNLKYLAKRELGVDQWELNDFFPDWKADSTGTVRAKAGAKKKGSRIDFSYMDYDGTRVYAPTDGDVTFQLFTMYKADMLQNHKDMEYIYNVEIIVSAAIAYMEFYGHKLDEAKILNAREQTKADLVMKESEIRQTIQYSSEEEIEAYNKLSSTRELIAELEKSDEQQDKEKLSQLEKEMPLLCDNLKKAIESNTTNTLNLSAPGQVAELFYNKLGYPMQSDKMSVDKKSIKGLLKEKNEDGTAKCPVAAMYSEYKNKETQLTKFFDNLPYFMYPGGFIFSSYGQISTATGRMSCSKPNAQQYPKLITKIVVPRDGYIMCDADYSQIEYRVLTALAGNEWLAELFSNPDSDYHTLMASLMYGVDYSAVTPSMRSAAKSFNFGIPYGMGLGSLAILLTGKNTAQTRDEAAEKMEDYFRNQPKTRQFFDNVKEMAQVNSYTKTLFNRYRYYTFVDKDGNVNNGKKAAALRQAGNAVIQGCLGGETKIETKSLGIVHIKDVVGYSGEVWNGTSWTHGDVLYSGKKQKCIITFTNGQKFICSPIHRFKVCRDTFKAYPDINPCWQQDVKTDGHIGGSFVRCEHLKKGMCIDINLDKSKICVNDFDNRFVKATCYTTSDDDFSTPYTYENTLECVQVESVEITDEYIDMYDVCNTDDGYYVADGIVTHNTAADIFKIGVARNFSYIRKNKLFGKLLIVNMVHDEQLMEVDVQHLNAQRILADVGKNMQFKIDGFPPLYIGAGVGKAWGYAKGKMAEIHPTLLEQFTKEAENIPIYREDTSTYVEPHEVLDYFDNRIYEFRRKKVADYLSNPENWGKEIHPAIGGLINLQFNYGRGDDAKAYVGPNGEKYSDKEFLELNIGDFLKENGIDAKPEYFKANETMSQQKEEDEEKEDKEYVDGEDGDELDDILDETEDIKLYSQIDESNKLFGSSIQDIIGIFGACVIAPKKICGIDTRDVTFRQKDSILDYIMKFICDENDEGALEIVFLKPGNILGNTGVYVNNIDEADLERHYKAITNNTFKGSDSDFTEGDVKNRSQAK